MTLQVQIAEGEYWWGIAVNSGHEMPISQTTECVIDSNGSKENDQFAPLVVSSKGRYIWSERPYCLRASGGELTCEGVGEITLYECYENLRGAYLAAMEAHFPFTGEMPDPEFFAAPQYNTWIELGTDQTTENIMRYARDIVDHGLQPGVFMIDAGWEEDYCVFEFNKRKIPDPAQLVYDLKQMGFRVMLWVSPIAASAGPRYMWLKEKGYLVCGPDGEPAVRWWWSGYSAVLDMTNPEAAAWYHAQLKSLMDRYDIDGFKFDAGDRYFYQDDDRIYRPMLAREHTAVFNQVGEQYRFNEFRAGWKSGGRPIVARLHDKYHSWTEYGINTLIPHTILQGLLGYAYCCPDMVGGGILDCFTGGQELDQELFVRWAQANALMGMMQMSISPWRVLNEENTKLVIDAVQLHSKYSDLFLRLGENAAKTGEPVVRHMAYGFPEEGFETVDSQFMVGSELLVAPVLEKGARQKEVKLPQGKWRYQNGTLYDGGQTVIVRAELHELPYFTKE